MITIVALSTFQKTRRRYNLELIAGEIEKQSQRKILKNTSKPIRLFSMLARLKNRCLKEIRD
jgi:hypothetical protein